MRKILKIFVCFIGIMISASTVSASKLEILSESEDYEKIVELADEIVSITNGGPVEDPFEEGIRVSDIDFDNALKEYIDTPHKTSELLSVSEVERALEQSEEYNHSYKREVSYLVVHSILHLLGYDHMEEDDKLIMRKREEELLGELNISR